MDWTKKVGRKQDGRKQVGRKLDAREQAQSRFEVQVQVPDRVVFNCKYTSAQASFNRYDCARIFFFFLILTDLNCQAII